jgi:hypothetical protein
VKSSDFLVLASSTGYAFGQIEPTRSIFIVIFRPNNRSQKIVLTVKLFTREGIHRRYPHVIRMDSSRSIHRAWRRTWVAFLRFPTFSDASSSFSPSTWIRVVSEVHLRMHGEPKLPVWSHNRSARPSIGKEYRFRAKAETLRLAAGRGGLKPTHERSKEPRDEKSHRALKKESDLDKRAHIGWQHAALQWSRWFAASCHGVAVMVVSSPPQKAEAKSDSAIFSSGSVGPSCAPSPFWLIIRAIRSLGWLQ